MPEPAHRRIKLVTGILGILVCMLMMLCALARADERSDGADIAVLKNRSDAIDIHLTSTDHNVSRLYDKMDEVESRLSVMQGEEYAAWGFLTLLGMGNLIVLKKKAS